MWLEVKTLTDLRRAAETLCNGWAEHEIPQDKIFDCRLVVNELVGNVLRHSDGIAFVAATVEDGYIEIRIRSTKPFIPPIASVCSSTEAESGRGLFLVDNVSVSRSVTEDGEIKVVVKY